MVELAFCTSQCRKKHSVLTRVCWYLCTTLETFKLGMTHSLKTRFPLFLYWYAEVFCQVKLFYFFQHMFQFYSGQLVLFTLLGLVYICQGLNGSFALLLCSSNYPNAPVKLKWLCLRALSESILLLNNEVPQVFHISVST